MKKNQLIVLISSLLLSGSMFATDLVTVTSASGESTGYDVDAITKIAFDDTALKIVASDSEGTTYAIDEINKITHKEFGLDRDLIGYVYEYFLKEFAVNATKEDGEFYTPHDAVQLIANMIEPYNGTLYDPCCGSGGMFIQSADIVKAKRGDISGINVYGQEKEGATYRLAKMNLALRGISHHLGDVSDSTFTNDLHRGIYFNYIMANPPFNLKNWYDDNLKNDARWADYTTPPASNANYAWILHILSHMKPLNGVAGFLLANGALNDEDTLDIRRKLIENDKVEAIIVLPRELFIIISNLYNVENSHGIRYVLAA